MHTTTLPRPRPPRPHRAIAVAVLSLATLLAACGGGSDEAAEEATTPTEAATGATTSDGTDAETTDAGTGTDAGTDEAADDGALPEVDICSEITQADMEAILPEATFSSVAPNDVTPAPTCEYRIELTGGIEASVVQILLAAEEPDDLQAQRDIQTDAVDVPGLDDAFAYDDFGTIVVQGESGVFLVERGVELTEGGTAASQDQMIAIAERVAAL
jgi:hypothetical protein